MELSSNPAVMETIRSYPKPIQAKLIHLRQLILETAEEIVGLSKLEETLKWGEPSYLTKKGSTLRIDWKAKKPDQYAIYFKCTSKLVVTFKEVFGDLFKYETTRAIVFTLDEEIPEKSLKQCISMTFRYHDIKHLPLLGAKVD